MYSGSDHTRILLAQPSDGLLLRKLALDSRIDAWSEADYAEEISRPRSFVLKASAGRNVVGFLVARIVPGSDGVTDAELYNIGVADSYRRKGIGSHLMADLRRRLEVAGVQNLWLEVRESNDEAISFYEKLGFRAEVTRKNFYSNPVENAVIMQLRIGEKE